MLPLFPHVRYIEHFTWIVTEHAYHCIAVVEIFIIDLIKHILYYFLLCR